MLDNLHMEAARISRDEVEGGMVLTAYVLLTAMITLVGVFAGSLYVLWSWL